MARKLTMASLSMRALLSFGPMTARAEGTHGILAHPQLTIGTKEMWQMLCEDSRNHVVYRTDR